MLFPDGITERNAPPFGAGLALQPWGVEPEPQWAGARAHNRGIAELCQMAPHRRIGLAIVPMLYDVDEAVREVQWAHDHGLEGILASKSPNRRKKKRGAPERAPRAREWR